MVAEPQPSIQEPTVEALRSQGHLAQSIGLSCLGGGIGPAIASGFEMAQDQLPGAAAMGFVALNFLVVSGGCLAIAYQRRRQVQRVEATVQTPV